MLRLFRSNQILFSGLLIFYLGIVRLSAFIRPLPDSDSTGGLLGTWIEQLSFSNSWIEPALAIIVLFVLAILTIAFAFGNRLLSPSNLFPGLFIALIGSAIPPFLDLHAFQLANIFLLLTLGQLVNTFRRNKVAEPLFNAGFFLALASLFAPEYLSFALLGIVALITLRQGKLQEMLIFLIGILVPHFLIGVGHFWYDALPTYLHAQWVGVFAFPTLPVLDRLGYIQLGLMLFLVLSTLIGYSGTQIKTTIDVRKRVDLLYWMLFIGGLTVLVGGRLELAFFQILVLPLSIITAMRFTKASPRVAEALHLIFLAVVLLLQYVSYFL